MHKATLNDLPEIIALLNDDELGSTREQSDTTIHPRYLTAFKLINQDPNQFLMVVTNESKVVIGTCHLTLMPSLTFTGSTRLQIEAVRVAASYRGQKIGEWMIKEAIALGKTHGATIIQLTTNIKRPKAKSFYEKLGFESTHVGMKLYLDSE
jgi:ribosomal protein S18 acetylase RimI-like enzyme